MHLASAQSRTLRWFIEHQPAIFHFSVHPPPLTTHLSLAFETILLAEFGDRARGGRRVFRRGSAPAGGLGAGAEDSTMHNYYQARWTSRPLAAELRKHGRLGQALLLDTFNGLILIEPRETPLGDGAVLSPQEADYELRDVWYSGPRQTLREARRRLGLEASASAEA